MNICRTASICILLCSAAAHTVAVGQTNPIGQTIPRDNVNDVVIDSGVRIDPNVLEQNTPGPSVRTGGRPEIELAEVTTPTALRIRTVVVQGRGEIQQLELSYRTRVRNLGGIPVQYRILTEVSGAADVHESSRYAVGSNGELLLTERFRTEFALGDGASVPISVVLADLAGNELARVDRTVDVSHLAGSMRMDQGQAVGGSDSALAMDRMHDVDLAVADVSVELRLPADPLTRFVTGGPAGLVNLGDDAATIARVTLRNAGQERWGYASSLSIVYEAGTPGRLRPLTGVAGVTKALPGGLRPGESTQIELIMPELLSPGYFYTGTVTFLSPDDDNAANNTQTITFFVETDGRTTTAREATNQ